MTILGFILLFTFLGSVASLIGGVILLYREQVARNIAHLLASFAAGTLLGTAFFDLLPEALEVNNQGINVFFWSLFGILVFFLFERFIHWFHHPHEYENERGRHTATLVIFGDSLHNFIDGIIIAGTFLVSIPVGIATSIAVALHEIPQEVGDFGILLREGLPGKRVLILNVLSSFTALVGALLTFLARETIEPFLPILLSITAGFFIYISASDLIPEIHQEKRRHFALFESFLLIMGVLTIWLSTTLLE